MNHKEAQNGKEAVEPRENSKSSDSKHKKKHKKDKHKSSSKSKHVEAEPAPLVPEREVDLLLDPLDELSLVTPPEVTGAGENGIEVLEGVDEETKPRVKSSESKPKKKHKKDKHKSSSKSKRAEPVSLEPEIDLM